MAGSGRPPGPHDEDDEAQPERRRERRIPRRKGHRSATGPPPQPREQRRADGESAVRERPLEPRFHPAALPAQLAPTQDTPGDQAQNAHQRSDAGIARRPGRTRELRDRGSQQGGGEVEHCAEVKPAARRLELHGIAGPVLKVEPGHDRRQRQHGEGALPSAAALTCAERHGQSGGPPEDRSGSMRKGRDQSRRQRRRASATAAGDRGRESGCPAPPRTSPGRRAS